MKLSLIVAIILSTTQACFNVPPLPGTGTATKSLPSTLPLTQRWCIQDSGLISYPRYANGLVFVIDGKTPVVTHKAFAATTGALAWMAQSPNRNNSAGARKHWLVDDKYYVTGDDGSVTVLDTLSGAVLWQQNSLGLSVGFASGDNKLFVGTQASTLAYDLATGNLQWSVPGQERHAEAPLFDSSNNGVILDQAVYMLLEPNTGKSVFQAPERVRPPGYASFNKGIVYNGLLLYEDEVTDVMTQRLIHPMSIESTQYDLPAIVDNYLLLAVLTDVITFDLKSYTQVWQYHALSKDGQPVRIVGGPVGVGDNVYVLLANDTLLALDLRTGRETGVWQGHQLIDVMESGPTRGYNTPLRPGLATGDGMLFATFGTDELCAFGSKP